MQIKIIGKIESISTIAEGSGIRDLSVLRSQYGIGNWKKKKGFAKVNYKGIKKMAEIHWYEAHGIGRVKLKIKRWL